MTSKQSDPGVIDVKLLLDSMKAIASLKKFEDRMIITGNVVEAEARKIKNAFNKLKAPTIAVPKVGAGAGARGFTGAGAEFIGPLFPKGENARLKDANIQLVNLKTNTQGAKQATDNYKGSVAGATTGLLKFGAAIQAFRLAARFTSQATQDAAEYSLRLAEIATLTDEVAFSSKEQEAIVRRVSDTYGEKFLQTAPALYDAISAGATNAAEANAVLDSAVKLSIGTISTQATATSLLVGVLNSYGDEVEGAAQVTDDFFAIVRQGKLRLDELDPSLGRITPLAKAAGISFKELGASIVALTRSGSSASEAITKIRSIINATIKKQDDFDKAFQRVGLRFDSTTIKNLGFIETLQTLQRALNGNNDEMGKVIGRVEGLAGLLSLVDDDARLFSEAMDGMAGSAGRADQALAELRSSGGRAFDELKSKLANFRSDFGSTFVEEIGDAARAINLVGSTGGREESLDRVIQNAIETQKEFSSLEKSSESLRASLQDLGAIDVGSLVSVQEFILDSAAGSEIKLRLDPSLDPGDQAKIIKAAADTSSIAGEEAGDAFIRSLGDSLDDQNIIDSASFPLGVLESDRELIILAEGAAAEQAKAAADQVSKEIADNYPQAVLAGVEPAVVKLSEDLSKVLTGFAENSLGEFEPVFEAVPTDEVDAFIEEFKRSLNLGSAGEGTGFVIPISIDPLTAESDAQKLGAQIAKKLEEGIGSSVDPSSFREVFEVAEDAAGNYALSVRGALDDGDRIITIDKERLTVAEALAGAADDAVGGYKRQLEVAAKVRDQYIEEAKARDLLLNRTKDQLRSELERAKVAGDSDEVARLSARIENLQEIDRLNQTNLSVLKAFSTPAKGNAEDEAELARRVSEVVERSKVALALVNERSEATERLLSEERKLANLKSATEGAQAAAQNAQIQAQLTGALGDQLKAIELNRRAEKAALVEQIAGNQDLGGKLQERLGLVERIAEVSSQAAIEQSIQSEISLSEELFAVDAQILELTGRQLEAELLLSKVKTDSLVGAANLRLGESDLTKTEVDLLNELIARYTELGRIQKENAESFAGAERGSKRASALAEIAQKQAQVTLSLTDQIAAIEASAAAENASNEERILKNKELKEEYQALIPLTQALANAQVNDLINQQLEREVDLRGELGEINADLLSILGKERQATLALNVEKTEAAIAERERLLLNTALSEVEIRLLYEQIGVLRQIKEQQQAIADASFGEALVFGYEQAIDAVEDWAEAGERAGQGLALITRQLVNDLANNQFSWEALGQTAIKVIGNIIAELLTLYALQKLTGSFGGGFSLEGLNNVQSPDDVFARGGIMQGEMLGSGNLPVNAYAGGGVANSPQLAIFGEGNGAEAFVPLPDGKSIPVKLDISGLAEMQKLTMNLINRVEMAHSSMATQMPIGSGDTYNDTTEISMPITVDARGAQDPAQVEASVDRAIDRAMPRIADTLGGTLMRGRSAKLVRGVRSAQRGGSR